MSTRFVLDRAGVGAILKGGEVRSMVGRATAATAGHARGLAGPGVEIVTRQGTTDRAVGQVIIADPKGLGLQATDGVLTKAAAAIGVEVKSR